MQSGNLAELPCAMKLRPATLLFVSAVLCLAAASCWAQPTRIADLSLTAEMQPPSPIQPGTSAFLTLRFTNGGPDDLPAVGAGSSAYAHLDFEVISLVAAPPSICQMYYDDLQGPPGQPSYLMATVFAGALSAGETKVCTVRLSVSPNASGSMDLGFFATDGQVFIDDSNLANNRVDLALNFGTSSSGSVRIPAASASSLLFLLAAVVLAACTRLRAQPRSSYARRVKAERARETA